MAKFCGHCGAKLQGSEKFCAVCGAKVADNVTAARQQASVPTPPRQPARSPAQTPQSVPRQAGQPIPPQPVPQQTGRPIPPSAPVGPQSRTPAAAEPSARRGSPGAALCAALLSIELLPYLLKSLLFASVKTPLGSVPLLLLDVLGYVAAGLILLIASKRATGKARLGAALLLPAAWAGLRMLYELLVTLANEADGVLQVVLVGLGLLSYLLFAVLLLSPLRRLFSPRENARQKGRVLALLLTLLALLIAPFLPLAWSLLPFRLSLSFFSTAAYRLLLAALEAGALTLAALWLLRKAAPGNAPPKARRFDFSLLLGAGLAVFSLVLCLISSAKPSLTESVRRDVELHLAQSELLIGEGNMNAVLDELETAEEHRDAWLTVAAGNRYELPAGKSSDTILRYLSLLDRDLNTVRRELILAFDEEEIEIMAPLMLRLYREAAETRELTEQEQAHRTELIAYCIADESFEAFYPTAEELREEQESLTETLAFGDGYMDRYDYTVMIARMQRGGMDLHSSLSGILNLAEKYPENLSFQLFAGYVISENTWDNSPYYNRGAAALERYLDLWNVRYLETAADKETADCYYSVAGMLQQMKHTEEAVPLLEEALARDPDNDEARQLLASCYLELRETENGFALTKQLYESDPDNPSVIWSYCVGALKQGEQAEAVRAAARLAEHVQKDLGENADGSDQLLFSLVLYLGINDNSYWTDYRYRVYNGENTDEALLRLFQSNALLYNYVQAVYWEKEKQDPAAALPFAKQALALQEDSGRLWYLNGMIHYDSEDFDEALEAYRRADRLEPDDPAILFALANTYDALEDYRTAFQYCERAMSHFPNGADHAEDLYGVSYHAPVLYRKLQQILEKEGN